MLVLHCCVGFFSSCGEWRLLSSCQMWLSHLGSFPGCRGRALGCVGFSNWSSELWSTGSVVEAHRLSFIVTCGSFPDQGSNPHLLHWQADSLPLSHQGSPAILFMVTLLRESICVLCRDSGLLHMRKKERSRLVVSDSATPWTVAYQAPLSMGFSRQEYWSGLPFPSPGDLPYPGVEPGSPAL